MILFYEYNNKVNYTKHFNDAFGDKLENINTINYFNERLIVILSFSTKLNRKKWPQIKVGKSR